VADLFYLSKAKLTCLLKQKPVKAYKKAPFQAVIITLGVWEFGKKPRT
jgi:hypothetical protein